MKIVECVPNYSISNNPFGIEAILRPFMDMPQVHVLNVEEDHNYNRCVVTVIGEPTAVKNAMVLSAIAACRVIDLNHHKGEHKRMGAIDVVPFIPLANMSVEETIALSECCAKEIYTQTSIPIYLYNLSAKREQCKNLADIRKGEFEGMFEKVKQDQWKPDFGTVCHPTAGVCAVGCRKLLVAYNIDLNTSDRKIAAAIAQKVRYSGGGYRGIQALPVSLKDKEITQVTMNITDYHQTALYQAYEAVKMEARRFDVDVIGSEIVGLVPLDCLKESAAYYLKEKNGNEVHRSMEEIVEIVQSNMQIHDFSCEKVLEMYFESID